MINARLLAGVLMALLSAETGAYAAWRLVGGPQKLSIYQEERRSALGYRYDASLGLVMPEPDTEFVRQQHEFVERCRASAIPGVAWGLFDDGLNPERPVTALVLGDSMTRGFGSTDCLQFGWVERVERALGWVDLVNLAVLGAGQPEAFHVYDRVGPHIAHDLVLINVFSGNDFLDNTEPFDWNVALAGLPAGQDPTAVLQRVTTANLYRPSDELLLGGPLRSYAAWLLVRVVEKVALDRLLPEQIRAARGIEDQLAAAAVNDQIPEALRRLGREQRRRATAVQANGMAFTIYEYQRRPEDTERLVQHAAGLINRFWERLDRNGIRALVIFHPSKEEVYLPAEVSAALGVALDAPLDRLRGLLAPDLPVCDLREALRRRSADGPSLYYARDGHYTPVGYEAAAEVIGTCLEGVRKRQRR